MGAAAYPILQDSRTQAEGTHTHNVHTEPGVSGTAALYLHCRTASADANPVRLLLSAGMGRLTCFTWHTAGVASTWHPQSPAAGPPFVPVVCVVLLIECKRVQVRVLHMASPVVFQPSSNPVLLVGVGGSCRHSVMVSTDSMGSELLL